jgi:hypothetical protein
MNLVNSYRKCKTKLEFRKINASRLNYTQKCEVLCSGLLNKEDIRT